MASTSPYSIVMLGTSSPAAAEDAEDAEEASEAADEAALEDASDAADDAEEASLEAAADDALAEAAEDSLSEVADASPVDAADDALTAEVAELSFEVEAGFEPPHPATAAAAIAIAMRIETILSFFIFITSLLLLTVNSCCFKSILYKKTFSCASPQILPAGHAGYFLRSYGRKEHGVFLPASQNGHIFCKNHHNLNTSPYYYSDCKKNKDRSAGEYMAKEK